MDDVDLPLVVGIALLVAGEIAEIAAGREDRMHARHLGDLVGVLQSLQRFDHQDQHDIVVDGVAIAAGNIAPHVGIERVAAAEAALAERREIGPIPGRDRFLDGVDGRDDEHQRAGIERMLDLEFVRVWHPRAGNRLGVRAGPPRHGGLVPCGRRMLHLGPDEVVSGIGHGAIGARIGRRDHGAADQLAALHQLDLRGIPNLGARRRIESGAVFPGVSHRTAPD